ncbi:Arc family DNA-binding protein [Bradyrhizobium sp. CCBAU 53380]|uniref:Arc family DNA-binding protein n=1 Tax=Bradyrhizobium sp. CCBAU 53380 TaxID=1325117 RepID=UPI002303F1F3|nr:Arc family DNA-binding protein [Bradyrhizobium sp. CCBAU 53380]MDA9424033.1 hypothetical protein [Bradyrhizobium sp. CCBAU 53380]
MPRKPSDIVQYKLRIRESLRRKIEKAAEKNRTSANQEMVSRLEASFDQEELRSIRDATRNIKEWLMTAERAIERIGIMLLDAGSLARVEQLTADERAALNAGIAAILKHAPTFEGDAPRKEESPPKK